MTDPEVREHENKRRAARLSRGDGSGLDRRKMRFNELQRDLDGISQKVLTDSLRQMIDDGLAYRHDYRQMPPRVEYGLTELGRQMLPIIDALADFGNYYKTVAGEK